MSDKIKIQIVSGVEGPSVYINDRRVAGPKPWGGGKIVYEFFASASEVNKSLTTCSTLCAALGEGK